MQLHQLRYTAAVARSASFSRAAELCHVSQPSLSQQIQKLEEELGVRLFDRVRGKVKLTEAGERFLPRALRILEEVDAAEREARDANQAVQGRLVIGALPTIAPYLLPPLIAQFSAEFPQVKMVVQEDLTANLIKLMAAFELDFAVASHPVQDERFEIVELFSEELLLALPAKHPLATKRAVTLADLETEQFIIMKEGHCLGDQVLSFCHRSDFQPQISCRSAQMETVHSLIRSGLGISLVPQMSADSLRDRPVLYRSLSSPKPERKIIVLWPRQRPPGRAGVIFLERLKAVTQGR